MERLLLWDFESSDWRVRGDMWMSLGATNSAISGILGGAGDSVVKSSVRPEDLGFVPSNHSEGHNC